MSEILNVVYHMDRRCMIDNTSPYFSAIREHFSYDNPAARFSKYPNIPKRLYTVSPKGLCDIGFLWNIKELILREEWDLTLNISDRVRDIAVNPLNIEIKGVPNTKYQARDYQLESIQNAFDIGNGIGLIGTGGGKSLIIASMMESIYHNDNNFKALLVVPNLGLVDQMFNDFKEYGCTFTSSRWTGKKALDSTTNVVIVNTSLLQRFDAHKIDAHCEFFSNIRYLFYDEVHLFGNEPEPKATVLLKSYEYDHVFGFTGSLDNTTFNSDRVYGFFGKPFYSKTSKSLRDENYLTEVDIMMLYLNHSYDPKVVYDFVDKELPEIENYNREIEYITKSKFRVEKLKKLVSSLNGNVLLLVERIKQGEMLLNELHDIENKRIYFIRGSMDVDQRNEIIKEMEKSNDIVCIAMSKIFSTGISINNLPYAIFYYIGKAWNKTIQSIGRGLRLHENKSKFVIFDLCDNMKYSEKHSNDRKNIYLKEKIQFTEHHIYEKK